MSDKKTSSDKIIVKNKRIVSFYSDNPAINFEAVNLIFVDLFERLLGDMNSTMNATINSQILSTVDNLKTESSTINSQILSTVANLKSDSSTINSQILSNMGNLKSDIISLNSMIGKLNSDITNSICIKFQESKREYIEDIKTIFSNDFSQNTDKINSLLQLNTSQLVDKTTLLLNEVIPKSNEGHYKQLQESINIFQNSISDDTQKLLNSINKEDSLSVFLSTFENKSNNLLLQPLYTYINASEERINNNLNSIKNNNDLLQPLYTYINASEERINNNLISLKDNNNNSVQDKIMNELSEFLGKYKNSSYKGQFGENQLESVLNQLFPTGEILNTTGKVASCDFRVNRLNLPTILFETKNYDRNVTIDEVKKFIRDIGEQKCHGIFLSQHSGITSKQNYQIDIKGSNILVYVHNVDYSPQSIKIATDIIDSLADRLAEIEDNIEEINIPQETLDEINKEYASFIERKSKIIDYSKEFIKKITNDVDDIKFPSLSKFLSLKCGSILNDETIMCDICHQFKANNNKAIAAHKRACKKKFDASKNDSNIVIDTNS